MPIVVKIDTEDNREVRMLFHKYNALLDVLAYIYKMSDEKHSDFLERKIEEAVALHIELEAAKSKCENKYRPNDQCTSYSFNFINETMIFEVE